MEFKAGEKYATSKGTEVEIVSVANKGDYRILVKFLQSDSYSDGEKLKKGSIIQYTSKGEWDKSGNNPRLKLVKKIEEKVEKAKLSTGVVTTVQGDKYAIGYYSVSGVINGLETSRLNNRLVAFIGVDGKPSLFIKYDNIATITINE